MPTANKPGSGTITVGNVPVGGTVSIKAGHGLTGGKYVRGSVPRVLMRSNTPLHQRNMEAVCDSILQELLTVTDPDRQMVPRSDGTLFADMALEVATDYIIFAVRFGKHRVSSGNAEVTTLALMKVPQRWLFSSDEEDQKQFKEALQLVRTQMLLRIREWGHVEDVPHYQRQQDFWADGRTGAIGQASGGWGGSLSQQMAGQQAPSSWGRSILEQFQQSSLVSKIGGKK